MRVAAVIAARERYHRGQAALARGLLAKPWGEENREALEDLVTLQEAKAQVLAGIQAWCSRADLLFVLPELLSWCLGRPAVETPYLKGWDPGSDLHSKKGRYTLQPHENKGSRKA